MFSELTLRQNASLPDTLAVDRQGLVALLAGDVDVAGCQDWTEPNQRGPLHKLSPRGLQAVAAEAGRMSRSLASATARPETPERIELRAVATGHGVWWFRKQLGAHGAGKLSELSDEAVAAILAAGQGGGAPHR